MVSKWAGKDGLIAHIDSNSPIGYPICIWYHTVAQILDTFGMNNTTKGMVEGQAECFDVRLI